MAGAVQPPPVNLLDTLSAWWASDTFGVILLTPLLLAGAQPGALTPIKNRPREFIVWAVTTATAGSFIFFYQITINGTKPSLLSLALIPVIWATMRFAFIGMTLSTFTTGFGAILGLAMKLGPIDHPARRAELVQVSLFIVTVLSVSWFVWWLECKRDHLEATLRERDCENRALLDAIPDLIFTNRRDGEYLDFRASDPTMLFVPAELFLGRKIPDILPQPVADQFMKAIADTLDSGARQEVSYSLPIAGTERHFEARLAPCGEDRVVSLVRDITTREQMETALRVSEARYQRAERGTHDGLWERNVITDHDYRSARWREILGYGPHDLLTNSDAIRQLIHPEDRERVQSLTEINLLTGKPFSVEMRMRHKNGEYIWVLSRGVIERDTEGKPLYISGSIGDITKRKRLETDTNALLEKAREVAEMRARFISVASHGFRTPMTVVKTSMESLHHHFDRLAPARREDIFRRIDFALNHMTELLDDVLVLNRLDTTQPRLELESIELRPFADRVVEEIRISDHEAHRFEIHLAAGPTSFVTAGNLLREILSNLVGNAVRYSPSGTLVTVRLEANDERLRIAVEDQGIGIVPADRTRIFEAFERGSNVGQIAGTGLGLNIAKRMTESLGGTIAAAPLEPGGTRFTLELPGVTAPDQS